MTYTNARRQRLAEAVAAQRAATERVLRLLGVSEQPGVSERVAMQALAEMYAATHRDTPARQLKRRLALDKDALAFEVSSVRPRNRKAP